MQIHVILHEFTRIIDDSQNRNLCECLCESLRAEILALIWIESSFTTWLFSFQLKKNPGQFCFWLVHHSPLQLCYPFNTSSYFILNIIFIFGLLLAQYYCCNYGMDIVFRTWRRHPIIFRISYCRFGSKVILTWAIN